MIFFPIPISLVLIVILGIAGMGFTIKNYIEQNLFFILIAIGVGIGIIISCIILLFFILYLLTKLKTDAQRTIDFFGEIMMFLFPIITFFPLMNLSSLDDSSRFCQWFGIPSNLTFIFPILLNVIGVVCLIVIAIVFRSCFLSNIVLACTIILPFAIFMHSADICTQSWSDYQVNNVVTSNVVQECTIIEDSDAFYPALRGDQRFPSACPWKYKGEPFAKGEIVYTLIPLDQAEQWGYEYIPVGNCERAAYVDLNNLQLNETPVYTYSTKIIDNISEATVYASTSEERISWDGDPFTLIQPTTQPLTTLSANEPLVVTALDGELFQIQLPDGTLGYIERTNTQIVRTKIN